MKRRLTTPVATLAAALVAVGCGSDAPTPVTAGPSPFMAQVGGVWSGTQTLTSARGGGCIPVMLQPGTVEPLALSVQQTYDTLTARMSSAGTGVACNYAGKATLNSLVMDSSDCDEQLLVVMCQNGDVRDLKLAGSTINATVRGGVASGTIAYTYNVFLTGKSEGAGSLVARYDYTATRR
jgi:hypothetical protein